LRNRIEDIPALSKNFLSYYSARENKEDLHLSNDALKLLQQHPWRGNIRELSNVLERAVILADEKEILPEHLAYEIQTWDKTSSGNLSLASVEKTHIQKVLHHTKGNKTKAAEFLGIGLTTLYRKMEEYDISK
jgi:DNA-binding NtrC family response regulator